MEVRDLYRFLVMIRRTTTGYSVDVPDLPGCVATATTIEHARQMIAEAIEMHLDLMRQSGAAAPLPCLAHGVFSGRIVVRGTMHLG